MAEQFVNSALTSTSRFRVLLAHNFYLQSGGEDAAFAAERALLLENGHEVIEYTDTNERLHEMGRVKAVQDAIWSRSTYAAVTKVLRNTRPDVAHFHNTFMMISPSAYYACDAAGVPVVQSMHNYRLFCPAAVLYRDEHICEECLGKWFAWPGIQHACYHESRPQTAVVAMMAGIHRAMGTWNCKISSYVATSEFSRRKFIEGGLPEAKLFVKPNFAAVQAPALRVGVGEYVLYAGRLSPEKGIPTLMNAWGESNPAPLHVLGSGPLDALVKQTASKIRSIQLLGFVDREEVDRQMNEARFLVFPSGCYENFPITIIEAFARRLPVIAARLGATEEIVSEGVTGLFFEPGDAADLAAKCQWLWERPEECAGMGENARREYEKKYTPESNYEMLMAIYSKAMAGESG